MSSPSVFESISPQAWEAIRGGYDLHVHSAPDVIRRRMDDIQLAHEFLACGLRGFILKSHYMPTAERARIVCQAVPGIEAYGSLTLNHAVGGLNPVAVELSGRSGCKLVWMPTVDAANEKAGTLSGGHAKLPFWAEIQRELSALGIAPPPISVLNESGAVTPAAQACLERIREHNMILATGHLGKREILALVRTAKDMGLRKVLVTHAEFPSQNLTVAEQVELADLGAVIEHCFTTPHTGKAGWDAVLEGIRAVGPARTIISTDLGQPVNPPVSEGLALFAQRLLAAGYAAAEVHQMAADNPARLLA